MSLATCRWFAPSDFGGRRQPLTLARGLKANRASYWSGARTDRCAAGPVPCPVPRRRARMSTMPSRARAG